MTLAERARELMSLGGTYWTGILECPDIFLCWDGRVASFRNGKARVLKGTRCGQYLAIDVPPRRQYIHTLMCEAFHGPRPEGQQVRHLDGNRDNNAPSNLRWGTPRENNMDKVRHGTTAAGERNPNAKLTPAEVQDMRDLRRNHGISYKRIAAIFGVTTMTAYRAVTRQSWK